MDNQPSLPDVYCSQILEAEIEKLSNTISGFIQNPPKNVQELSSFIVSLRNHLATLDAMKDELTGVSDIHNRRVVTPKLPKQPTGA